MRYLKWGLVLTGLLLFLGFSLGCSGNQKSTEKEAGISDAVSVLHPTNGNTVTGKVTFTQIDGGIRVVARVEGLTPGKHGFHIHQYGDCSSGDGKSAGGHFNPAGVAHGGPNSEVQHAGDLGTIMADSSGNGILDRVFTYIAFSGKNSIIGRAVIIHQKEDDLTSQPTGAAGARIACGVIGIAKQ